jgi:hypothetical protein
VVLVAEEILEVATEEEVAVSRPLLPPLYRSPEALRVKEPI